VNERETKYRYEVFCIVAVRLLEINLTKLDGPSQTRARLRKVVHGGIPSSQGAAGH